jgi:hypothetical protein
MSSASIITVKSTSSYTSEFVGSTADPCMTRGILYTSPDVFVTGNCFYLDYSTCKNSSDLKFLKKFFDNLSTGNTFNFSSGVYFVPETGTQTTWSGQFTLQGKTGSFNEYLSISGVSGVSGLTGPNYHSVQFTSPIQFTATSGATAQYLQNHLPKDDPFNFGYLGLYGSDYGFQEYVQVDISTKNTGRLLVKNAIQLKDGSEIIYIDPSAAGITAESFYFNKAIISTLQRGDPPISIRNTNQNSNGLILVSGTTKNIVLDKQNRFQLSCRQNYDSVNNYTWYSNFNLDNLKTTSDPFINDGLSLNFTGFYSLKYLKNVSYSYGIASSTDTVVIKSTQYEDSIYVDDSLVNTLNVQYSSNPGSFRLDLSHAANIGTIFEFYLDSQLTTPLSKNYYYVGTPGYEGAAFIYLTSNTDSSKTIFIKCSRTSIKYLTINFI